MHTAEDTQDGEFDMMGYNPFASPCISPSCYECEDDVWPHRMLSPCISPSCPECKNDIWPHRTHRIYHCDECERRFCKDCFYGRNGKRVFLNGKFCRECRAVRHLIGVQKRKGKRYKFPDPPSETEQSHKKRKRDEQ